MVASGISMRDVGILLGLKIMQSFGKRKSDTLERLVDEIKAVVEIQ